MATTPVPSPADTPDARGGAHSAGAEAVDPRRLADVIERLRATIPEEVVVPGHPDYEALRGVANLAVDHRPAVFARPERAADVSAVVQATAEAGLPLAVRGGGHSVAGHGVAGGGVVLDLAALRGIAVDPERRSVAVQSGVNAGAYTAAAGEYGLATGFGDTAAVGVAGLTLGGGVGFLSRRYGLTVDSLGSAEIVLADGGIREIDHENDPDLFWAIRGGGGNFGVVTRLTFTAYELSTVTGGMIVLPATDDALRGAVSAALAAPDALSSMINLTTAPPMPFIPVDFHGQPVVMVHLCHAGPGDAASAIAPFRQLARPVVDTVEQMPYPQMIPPQGPPRVRAAIRTSYADSLDDDALAAALDAVRGAVTAVAGVQIRVLGGAIGRYPADSTAYAHRDRAMMVNVLAGDPEEETAAAGAAWADAVAAALSDDAAGYVNFLGDEGPERVRAAYPGATWDRLRAIKRRYDPANMFRFNQNIPPAE